MVKLIINVTYWANRLNIRNDELEKIIKKEIVTI